MQLTRMLTGEARETLRDRVYKLLWDVGMKMEHDKIISIMKEKGCKLSPQGRVVIPAELIDELIASQKETRAQDDDDQSLHIHYGPGVAWTHFIICSNKKQEMKKKIGSEFKMSMFGSGPAKFYDYPSKSVLPVDTKIFIKMMKFAESTSEIGYIGPWYRHDVPAKIERIDSLVLALKYTDKYGGGDVMYPEQIKYIKEISDIVMPDVSGNAPYLYGSIVVICPLIMGKRSLDDLLERKRNKIRRYRISTMPAIGMSAPSTIAGAVIQTCAELLGGMVAAYCMDKGGEISARVIPNSVDMRNMNLTSCGPETSLLGLGVKELFDSCFGGHLWLETFFAASAMVPGLQVVYENFYGAYRYGKLTGIADVPYPGLGNIGYMGVGSPTQAVLDMEIRKSQFDVKNKIEVNEENMNFEELCNRSIKGEEFLTSEHTLKHCHDIWKSDIFLNQMPETWPGNEKCILDKCDQVWRENIKNYHQPAISEDKIKALDKVLEQAKKELLN